MRGEKGPSRPPCTKIEGSPSHNATRTELLSILGFAACIHLRGEYTQQSLDGARSNKATGGRSIVAIVAAIASAAVHACSPPPVSSQRPPASLKPLLSATRMRLHAEGGARQIGTCNLDGRRYVAHRHGVPHHCVHRHTSQLALAMLQTPLFTRSLPHPSLLPHPTAIPPPHTFLDVRTHPATLVKPRRILRQLETGDLGAGGKCVELGVVRCGPRLLTDRGRVSRLRLEDAAKGFALLHACLARVW